MSPTQQLVIDGCGAEGPQAFNSRYHEPVEHHYTLSPINTSEWLMEVVHRH